MYRYRACLSLTRTRASSLSIRPSTTTASPPGKQFWKRSTPITIELEQVCGYHATWEIWINFRPFETKYYTIIEWFCGIHWKIFSKIFFYGGAPKYLLGQLSGVMRAAARFILVLPRRNHMTDVISTRLHWLGIPAQVVFKLCVLAFRCQHGSAPLYLAGYFIPVGAIEGWSSLQSLLVPVTKTVTIGPREFAVCSPTAWNNLSVNLRDPNLSFSCFRKKLKTFLFKLSSTLWCFSTSNCDCALLAAFETFYEKHLIIIIIIMYTKK